MQEYMKTCINNPSSVATALSEWWEHSSDTQESISEITGVDQSQVSRILSGDFVRITPKVKAVCKYAKITLIKEYADPTKSPILIEALKTTWDGSEQHAKAIAKVIQSLRNYR